MPHSGQQPATGRVSSARNAVAAVFAINGLAIATWMSRIPEVRDLLSVSPSELGRILLAMAAGSMVALPTAGMLVARVGATRTVIGGAAVGGMGMVVAALGADPASSAVLTAVGLVGFGYGSGAWDVAMNVEGAAIERLLDRTIMPRFHAAWSLGTVAGAGAGAAATAANLPVAIHLGVIGAVVALTPGVAARWFLPRAALHPAAFHAVALDAVVLDPVMLDEGPATRPKVSLRQAWRERRTLAIGVMVLSFALIEAIADDWLALGIVDGYRVQNAVGAAAFALFVTFMTIGRTFGTPLVDRYGRTRVLRVTGVLTAAGVLLVVFGQVLPVVAIGVMIWGLGGSLGFPLGMSAAADDPVRAPARVSVVASIGYTGFLAGPPVLGWLGDHEGVLDALLVVVAAAAVAFIAAPAARKPTAPSPERPRSQEPPPDTAPTGQAKSGFATREERRNHSSPNTGSTSGTKP